MDRSAIIIKVITGLNFYYIYFLFSDKYINQLNESH